YKALQQQFIKRKVEKRYVALLDGLLPQKKGYINLPLRGDLYDRPRQIVCYEHGKGARTRYEVIAEEDGRTRVHFYPTTGRTHQLRVHAAHPDGLDTPIVGDDLYGTVEQRLCLHAAYLKFWHPGRQEWLELVAKTDAF
ncbi:MAG: pseudouridine synthase, partial [Bacteroidota bacterium]